ncbi:MAG TPA: DUF2262 domain-containing protein [Candidatus Aquabacterium excrementipullorum]|nr:DUF2262 domain-containing protein [Candidatus Aquabacterium excrementipullorum]
MSLATALHRSKAALAHWGVAAYFYFALFWLTLSTPLYFAGWGLASVLSLPLLLLTIFALTYGVSAFIKPAPRRKLQPRPGFPDALEVPSLGTFPLSTFSDTNYQAAVDWCGGKVELSLSVETVESVPLVLLATASMVAASTRLNTEVARFAASALLPAINGERQAAGAASLTPEDFLQAISLQMIEVHADETYEFLYDDGDLLGGHWIEVHGHLRHGPLDVDTPG